VLVVGGGCTIEVAKSIAMLLPSSINAQALSDSGTTRDQAILNVVAAKEQAASPVVAVPTTFHGCVAASSNRTFLTDAAEGAVLNLSGDHLDRSGGVHVVVDPTLLRQSSPLVCAEGAISSLARISDSLLVNTGGKDDIGHDGGAALGELLATVKELLSTSFALHDGRHPSMGSWTRTAAASNESNVVVKGEVKEEEEEDICERYGAIGCVIGSCVSLGGPGVTQTIARVVASNYNLSFGQACALVLPHVVGVQLERAESHEEEEERRGARIHRSILDEFEFEEKGGESSSSSSSSRTMYDAFQRVRRQVKVPRPSEDNLKELTTSIMLDPSFKEAVEDENGAQTWTRKIIGDMLEASFEFLPELEEEEEEEEEVKV
jgi:alcohol dehydrogenase class IV